MMSNLKFSKATNLRNCIRILESLCGDVELVSFGLAPNPNGFCYEVHNESLFNTKELKALDDALEILTSEEENTLKELYL